MTPAQIHAEHYRLSFCDLLKSVGIDPLIVPAQESPYDGENILTPDGYLRFILDDKGKLVYEGDEALTERAPWPEYADEVFKSNLMGELVNYWFWRQRSEGDG